MATRGTTIKRMPSLPNEKLPLDFLNKITNNFSTERLLGTSAFGSYYKGTLEDGGEICVMKLMEESPVPAEKIFANEVQNIMVLDHENIAKLVAYCREQYEKLVKQRGRYIISDTTEAILCYESLPNGTLDKHIFGESSSMDWSTRFKIIKGITRGIQYLHTLPRRILHLGLNPSNIWLDENIVPKITDFGFSKIIGDGPTRKMTKSHVGTFGYMAPEYVNGIVGGREISTRSDIYSLGLIILEIATREKNSFISEGQSHAREYIDKVKTKWNIEEIMFKYPELESDDWNQIDTCIKLGLTCVEIDQDNRPHINVIVDMLN